jgi:hypothetical protein
LDPSPLWGEGRVRGLREPTFELQRSGETALVLSAGDLDGAQTGQVGRDVLDVEEDEAPLA